MGCCSFCVSSKLAEKDVNENTRPYMPSYTVVYDEKLRIEAAARVDVLEDLRNCVVELTPLLSKQDQTLVEDRLGVLRKKQNDVCMRAQKCETVYKELDDNLVEIHVNVEEYTDWLTNQANSLEDELFGHRVEDVLPAIKQTEEAIELLETKQSTADEIAKNLDRIKSDLTHHAQNVSQDWIRTMRGQHRDVVDMANLKKDRLDASLKHRMEFHKWVDAITAWLDERQKQAEQLSVPKLRSEDVKQQVNLIKTLTKEIEQYKRNMDQSAHLADNLGESCNTEAIEDISAIIQGLEVRYTQLLSKARDNQGVLMNHMSDVTRLEDDIMRVESSLKESNLRLDQLQEVGATMELMDDQQNKLESLHKSVEKCGVLVTDTIHRGDAVCSNLSESDGKHLRVQLDSLLEQHEKTSRTVEQRLEQLAAAIGAKSQIRAKIDDAKQWMTMKQNELRSLNKPLLYDIADVRIVQTQYQVLGDDLRGFYGDIADLNSAVESLQDAGQELHVDEINHLSSQHKLLMDQVSQQISRCETAVSLREDFLQHKEHLEDVIASCQGQVEVIKKPGVTNEDKIIGYKEVLAKINTADPILAVVCEKGYQVSREGTADDCSIVSSQLELLQSEVEHLKTSIESEYSQCEQIKRDRENLESMTAKAIDWLEQRCDMMATKTTLDMDPEKVDQLHQKHQNLEDEILSTLNETLSRTQLQEMYMKEAQEPVPQSLTDHLSQLNELQSRIQRMAEDKRSYLTNAKTRRVEFEQSLKQVTAWLLGAEELLQAGHGGFDYENLDSALQDHKEYFSEASLCQDELEHINELSEQILPTLDANDQETLQQSLRNVGVRVTDAINAGQIQQDTMETKVTEYGDYQEMVQRFTEWLTECDEAWVALDSVIVRGQADLPEHVASVEEFQESLQAKRDDLRELNEVVNSLDKFADASGKKLLRETIHRVNERWHDLVTHSQNKLVALKELDSRYCSVTNAMTQLQMSLKDAHAKINTRNAVSLPSHQLLEQLTMTKDATSSLESRLHQVNEVKNQADSLLLSVPGAEAKVHIQKQMIEIMEEHGTLLDKAKEVEQSLQDEVDAREKLKTEIEQMTTYLQQIHKQLTSPSVPDISLSAGDKLAQNKEISNDVSLKMKAFNDEMALLTGRYSGQESGLPSDIEGHLKDVASLQQAIDAALKENDERVLQKQKALDEFNKLANELETSITGFTKQLKSKPDLASDAKQKHKDLGLELEILRKKIFSLKAMVEPLISDTKDKSAKKRIRRTVNTLEEQFHHLDVRYKKTTESMNKASALSDKMMASLTRISEFATMAREEAEKPDDVVDLLDIRPNIEHYTSLLSDVVKRQKETKSMKKQLTELEKLCDAENERGILNETVVSLSNIEMKLKVRLETLAKSNEELLACEEEFSSAWNSIDEANASISADTTDSPMEHHIDMLKHSISRLEDHKDKVDEILRLHPELRNMHPSTHLRANPDELASELTDVITITWGQLNRTERALSTYHDQEEKIAHLTEAIGFAEERLHATESTPMSGIECLQKQLEQHQELISMVNSYRGKIQDLNMKDPGLSKRDSLESSCDSNVSTSIFHSLGKPLSTLSIPCLSKYGSTCPDSGILMSDISQSDVSISSSKDTRKCSMSTASDLTQGFIYETAGISGAHSEVDSVLNDAALNVHKMLEPHSLRDEKPTLGDGSNFTKSTEAGLQHEVLHRKEFEPMLSSQIKSDLKQHLSVPLASEQSFNSHPSLRHPHKRSSLRPVTPAESFESISSERVILGGYKSAHNLQTLPSQWNPLHQQNLVSTSSEPNIIGRLQAATKTSSLRTSSWNLVNQREKLNKLNKSWNHIQKLLTEKESRLKNALSAQEGLQKAMKDITEKFCKSENQLKNMRPSVSNVDSLLGEHKGVIADIESIKDDLRELKQQSIAILASTDPQDSSSAALKSKISSLDTRVDSLVELAADKGKHLMDAAQNKERHAVEMESYQKHFTELSSWLDQARLDLSSTPEAYDSVDDLKQQQKDIKDQNQVLSKHLHQLSDLAVQCDNLCMYEPTASAQKLRDDLLHLQTGLGDQKMALITRQSRLRTALRESEKRQHEMIEYNDSVKKLQDWIEETKKLAASPSVTETSQASSQLQHLQKGLEEGLTEHRYLFETLPEVKLDTRGDSSGITDVSAQLMDLQQKWESLSNELARKRLLSEDLISRKIDDTESVALPHQPAWSTTFLHLRDAGEDAQIFDIRHLLANLSECWQGLQNQVENKQTQLDDILKAQHDLQESLVLMSSWVDNAETKLTTRITDAPPESPLEETESLLEEIKSLHDEISIMSRTSQEVLSSVSVESRVLITRSLMDLAGRVHMLELQAKQRETDLVDADDRLRGFQEDVKALDKEIQEVVTACDELDETLSADDAIERYLQLEYKLRMCARKLHRLQLVADEFSGTDRRLAVTLDLSAMRNHFMELQSLVHSKRDDLQKFYVVQEKYSKMLDDYTEFLETSQGKLKTDVVSAKDLHHLKQQLASHKDFFSDLDEHKSMLDSLERQCDRKTIDKLAVQQSHAQNMTTVVQDKASLHAQKLERLVRQWTDLEMKLSKMTRVLCDGQNEMPKPITDADTLEAVREKMAVYKRIARALGDEKSSVQEIIEKGKELLKSVTCPALETTIAEFNDKWIELNKSVNNEMKKAENLADQWQTFDADAAMLESWLISAKVQLSGLQQISDSDTNSISNIRAKVEKVVEFRKEVEAQQDLKNAVFASGQQLIRVKKSDSSRIERRLKDFADDWDQLLNDVTKTEEALHQAQMDLMPSRQALTEILIWIDEIEKMLREDKYSSFSGSAELELMLKKYKGYKIDMASKQLTVDFVNQTAIQLGHEPGDLMSEKTDFAEKLGQLNRRWQSVRTEVNEKYKNLESAYNKWQDYERTVRGLQQWLKDQEDRVKKFHLIGNESSVKATLRDCKILQASLSTKEHDIESCRREGMDLIDVTKDSPRCIQAIRDTTDKMKQQWSSLDQQLSELQGVLEEVLGQWNNYHSEQQTLSHVLSETEYCLGKYSSPGVDINALKVQVSKLKTLQSEFDTSSGRLDKFSTLSNQLMQVCDAPVKHDLLSTLTDMKAKWKNLSAQLASRIVKLDQTTKDWQRYNEEHEKVSSWLEGRENQHAELIVMGSTPGDRQQCLDQSKTLQLELDNFQSKLVALSRLGDDLVEGFDSPLAGIISSRQKILSQRLATLRHALTKHIHTLQDDLTDYKKFQQSFDAITNYLDSVEQNLSQKDPDKMSNETTIKRRLDELSDLSHQFTRRQQDLDALNDMGYRMALSEAYSEKLLGLNHRWHELLANTAERYRAMQALMLMQQDFHQKRENWMGFLTHTERDLTSDIAGNYKDLCDQQRKCEQFQVEVYNKQQVLQSILADGQRMLRQGEVPDRKEFQRKLTALSDQWQNVIQKADQFKSVIDDAVELWQTYFALSDRLNTWLSNKEYDLQAYEFDKTTLQKIKYLLEKSRSSLNDFTSQESNYKKLHTVCRELLRQSDIDAEHDLRKGLSAIQQRWYQIFSSFDGHRERLEDLMSQWQQCENDIEDVLNWLKDIRNALSADLPTGYDALQRHLHKCKDIETSFANSEDKRRILHARQTQLSCLVEADDLSVLNERIRLLDKQWEELLSQVCLRRQMVNGRLHSWQTFSQKYRELCDWIDETEAKISTNSGLTVEELLAFIETDYQEMMDQKEAEVTELTEEGRRLICASSDTRANDIHQKLAVLEDKWQKLKAIFNQRRNKLQETLATIQQLELSMSELRKWLANQEYELGRPLSYNNCEAQEITNKLDNHQNLHREIERRSAGVTSVLNLCEVLLDDSQACPAPSDYSALDKANKSLAKRWRNICTLATERRNLIEDTWQKWQKLISDCGDFSKWVKEIESELRQPVVKHSASVTAVKEDIKYFEAVEHKVHDHITKLEDINRQYRLLAREGRTDNSFTLKSLMQTANDQWDALLPKITSAVQKLKKNTGIQDEFETRCKDLIEWLKQTLLCLLEVESREDLTTTEKLVNVKSLKSLFELRVNEMDEVDKMAVLLIEQCNLSESAHIEARLDELHRSKREAIDSFKLCLLKLNKTKQAKKKKSKSAKELSTLQDETDVVVKTLDMTDSGQRADTSVGKQRVTAHVTPIPSHKESLKKSPGRKADKSGSRIDVKIEELAQALEDAAEKLLHVETQLRCVTPTGPDTDLAPHEYIRLLVECEDSIDHVKKCEERLASVSSGVTISGITSQVKSLLNRWEILNSRALEKDARLSEHREEWSSFQADLNTMSIWLSEAQAYRDNDRLDTSHYGYRDTSPQRRRDFDAQLDQMKNLIASLNIASKSFIYNRSRECRETRDRLRDINSQWEQVYAANSLYRLRGSSGSATNISDSSNFHYQIHDSLRWLEAIENKIEKLEPVTTIVDVTTMRSTYRQLVVLNNDMLNREAELTTLRETADRELLSDPSPEMSQARDKSRIICNRLRSLKRRCQAYIGHLENKLGRPPSAYGGSASSYPRGYGTHPTLDTATVLRSPLLWPRKLLSGLSDLILQPADIAATDEPNTLTTAPSMTSATRDDTTTTTTTPQVPSKSPLWRRVILTALPLYLLPLLLLLAALLIPICDDDCIHSNKFKWSLSPMKFYPDGPPPT